MFLEVFVLHCWQSLSSAAPKMFTSLNVFLLPLLKFLFPGRHYFIYCFCLCPTAAGWEEPAACDGGGGKEADRWNTRRYTGDKDRTGVCVCVCVCVCVWSGSSKQQEVQNRRVWQWPLTCDRSTGWSGHHAWPHTHTHTHHHQSRYFAELWLLGNN